MKFIKLSDARINLLISFFILWNLAAVPFSTSLSYKMQSSVQRFFSPYLKWTRLNQRWPLFTPTPRTAAMKYRVDIFYQDGSKKFWRRPYPPKWDFFERHLSYNFQKWDLASDYLKRERGLWRDLVNFIKLNFEQSNNPIAIIALVLETAPWPPPPETGKIWVEESALEWKEQTVFTYKSEIDWILPGHLDE